MNLWKLIISAITSIASVAHAQEIELISKRDAISVFSMSRARWISNVQASVAAGQAKSMGTPATGLSMVITTRESHMIVSPDFAKNEETPSLVQVSIAYLDPNVVGILKGAVLQSAIETARKQLAPEFELHANAEQVQGRLLIHFFITQKGK